MDGTGQGSVTFEHRKDTVCRDTRFHRTCSGRWRGVIDLGKVKGKRRVRKVSGRTKTAVLAELERIQEEAEEGTRTSDTLDLRKAVDDWIKDGLPGRSDKTKSK